MDACDQIKIPKTLGRVLGALPVLLVMAIESWVYYAYVIRLCGQLWHVGYPWLSVLFALLFHCIFALHVVSYYRVVMTSPGITSARVPDADDHEESSPLSHDMSEMQTTRGDDTRGNEQLDMITAKRNGQPRFCNKCSLPKPDRSHHCSMCDVCVLKMDHHCPWINNCVGWANQKFFYLFVMHGSLLSAYILVTVVSVYGTMIQSNQDVQLLFLMVTGAVFAVALGGFCALHTGLILSNKTTIESWDKHKYRLGESQVTVAKANLFDLGKYRNWTQVFGERRKLLWFLPVSTTMGDGWTFSYDQNAYDQIMANARDGQLTQVVARR